MDIQGAATPLSGGGLLNACQSLGVKAAEIWALARTETDFPYCGFIADKRPQILYERHIFSRLTRGKFDQTNPGVSNPRPGGYGAAGAHQLDRLAEAMALDESAALQSASWGIGQTLGTNHKAVGYASPQAMVADMCRSEDAQLMAAVNEILSTHIDGAFRNHDWANFARVYNGPGYAQNHYDTTLAANYAAFAAGKLPDLRVRAAQVYLMYLGHDPGEIDGLPGRRTRAAMNAFQAQAGLPVTDDLDDLTFRELAKAAA